MFHILKLSDSPPQLPTPPLPTPPLSVALLAVLAATLGGCGTNSYNRENTLGNVVELEAITVGVPRGSAVPTPDRPDSPSLRAGTLAREHWVTQSIFVPIDGTTHRPIYTNRFSYADFTARQRGEFPTVESSIVTSQQGSATAHAIEGAIAPFYAMRELAMMPIHMVEQHPFTTVSSPTNPPARYNFPGATGIVSGAGGFGRSADGGQYIRVIKPVETPLPPAPADPAPAGTGVTTSPAPVVPAQLDPTDPAKPATPGSPDTVWIYKDGKWRQVPRSEAPVMPR